MKKTDQFTKFNLSLLIDKMVKKPFHKLIDWINTMTISEDKIAKSKVGLMKIFNSYDQDIQSYFNEFEKLYEAELSLEIMLAYVFFKLEQGQRQALFLGARKRYEVDRVLTWKAIDGQHFTRENYKTFFNLTFGIEIPFEVCSIIEDAEEIRDKVMHGGKPTEAEKRTAICEVLEYCKKMNSLTSKENLTPYKGDLRGQIGGSKSINTLKTRMILKGLGYPFS